MTPVNFFLVDWLAQDLNPGLLDCEIPKREDQTLGGKGNYGVLWSTDVNERRSTCHLMCHFIPVTQLP